MAKIQIKPNPKATENHMLLMQYLDFCRDYGYIFEPNHLYDRSVFSYQQFCRMIENKSFKDQWAEDAKKFGRYIGE